MDAIFTVQPNRPAKARFTAKPRMSALLNPMARKKIVCLSMKHLSGKHDCFKYSFVIKGVLCVPCVLFGGGEVANDREKYAELKSFVASPFQKYEKISEKIKDHLFTKYYAFSQEKAERFIQCMSDSSEDVAYQQSEQHRKAALENRERLVPIVETILLCGRLGIALLGHRDDGELHFNSATVGMEGNFRPRSAFTLDCRAEILHCLIISAKHPRKLRTFQNGFKAG